MSSSADTETATTNYPDGRCRAVSRSANRRCRNSGGHGPRGILCATHAHETDPVTIDSDPRTLVKAVSPEYPARCRAVQYDGERCPTGCGPTDRFCALHKTISTPEVTPVLDDGELDTVLIKRALSAVEQTDQPRVMTDGGSEPWDPWCDWCQRAFGDGGPDWMVETDVVTGWFCSEDCADSWDDDDDYTPEHVGEQAVATDGGQSTDGTERGPNGFAYLDSERTQLGQWENGEFRIRIAREDGEVVNANLRTEQFEAFAEMVAKIREESSTENQQEGQR